MRAIATRRAQVSLADDVGLVQNEEGESAAKSRGSAMS
jgi:hypothetical protein